MIDTDIIIEVAKLDGWTSEVEPNNKIRWKHPNREFITYILDKDQHPIVWKSYLTSRDAIIPVIEKFMKKSEGIDIDFIEDFWDELNKLDDFFEEYGHVGMLISTPKNLCIALLKVTGKYHD